MTDLELLTLEIIAQGQQKLHPGPYGCGVQYEQSSRGNYIHDARGEIIVAEQDDTDCVLDDVTTLYIKSFSPERILVLIDEVKRSREKR